MEIKHFVSKRGRIRLRDGLISLAYAVIPAALQVAINQLQINGFNFDANQIIVVSAISGLQHLLRKLNESDRAVTITKPENNA